MHKLSFALISRVPKTSYGANCLNYVQHDVFYQARFKLENRKFVITQTHPVDQGAAWRCGISTACSVQQ